MTKNHFGTIVVNAMPLSDFGYVDSIKLNYKPIKINKSSWEKLSELT